MVSRRHIILKWVDATTYLLRLMHSHDAITGWKDAVGGEKSGVYEQVGIEVLRGARVRCDIVANLAFRAG